MEVSQFVGLVKLGEGVLADAFLMVANNHERDAGIRDTGKQLARFSQNHVQKLEPIVQRYGMQRLDEPVRLRTALFHGTRVGGLGLLRDLLDLSLLAYHVKNSWLSLSQAAGSLHDKELEGICSGCMSETQRQLAWLTTQIEDIAPQAITGTP